MSNITAVILMLFMYPILEENGIKERQFHTCNLRKSKGFHLVAQGADPIPDAYECQYSYKIKISKIDNNIDFYINDLHIFNFYDNESIYGNHIGGGKNWF